MRYYFGFPGSYSDRTDTLRLARPSSVNLITHKANTYLAGDSVDIKVDDYRSSGFRTLARDKTGAADKTFNLQALYQQFPAWGGPTFVMQGTNKIYFQWDIIRAGNIISSKTDSTDLIQSGTKNYMLNY